jgi:hypothetical protein
VISVVLFLIEDGWPRVETVVDEFPEEREEKLVPPVAYLDAGVE